MSTAVPSQSAMLPGVRSWWWIPAAMLMYGAALAWGLAAKSLGPFAPELSLDITLSHGRNGALTGLSQLINYGIGPAGAMALLLGICAWLLWGRGRPLQALAFGSVVAVGWVSSTIGKILVSRSRPPADAVSALVTETGLDSFPSGHTAFATALVLAAVIVLAPTRSHRLSLIVAGAVSVALVAFSRLYLGVHYLSDVAGSVVISSAAILAWLPVWNNLIAPRLAGTALIRRFEREQTPAR
ncbi:phosphatase PAP2 family protein [Arthrobacter sp. KFRI-F3372]|uniref:phosphatase PAP2 family protein n=1 Tax=Micrococcaceae TaxID=1268 RepID=UPI002783FC93|nr:MULTISPECIES: phosphatase PAP2 family protein [Micrococcaceae]MDP9989204.1 undecaprenyl-diphosphatase [Arthrobacter oryzae]MEE2523914.1 phosphatase PAP2 family protein [Pseudarthrobacter sp. J47]MEE2530343.1 phosphatase PAP2 family protein [Pseudarthrobacter sp. J75]WHP61102.1 phosphatase PAP2 family protein [Arthrobacter sp. KFRI-F3372]